MNILWFLSVSDSMLQWDIDVKVKLFINLSPYQLSPKLHWLRQLNQIQICLQLEIDICMYLYIKHIKDTYYWAIIVAVLLCTIQFSVGLNIFYWHPNK